MISKLAETHLILKVAETRLSAGRNALDTQSGRNAPKCWQTHLSAGCRLPSWKRQYTLDVFLRVERHAYQTVVLFEGLEDKLGFVRGETKGGSVLARIQLVEFGRVYHGVHKDLFTHIF